MKIAGLFLFLFIITAEAQTTKYFIKFTDKNNSTFSVSNPSAFLSPRAIARRMKQGIPIQQEDIPVNASYIDSVTNKGAVVFTRSKWFNGVTIEADSATLQSVLQLSIVQNATRLNRLASFSDEERRAKRKFENSISAENNSMANVSAYYGQSFSQIHIMNGDFLHDSGFTGNQMIIALLDAGFYHVNSLPAFEHIRTNNKIIDTWDFVTNDSNVFEDHEHGMEVLSTIAGYLPGQLIGTAPDAGFLLLRTEEAGTEHRVEEYNWEAGAEYADSAGADIISTSLGYAQDFTNPSENHTYAEMNGHTTICAKAANIAFSKGMLVLASAGNSGAGQWHFIGTPADGDDVLAVGAVNTSGDYAFFSSKGPSADGDIKPNVAAVGFGTTISSAGGAIVTGSGTSFSCPVLAGSAACLWQAYPGKSNREIFNAIQESASQHNQPDSLLGYGIPDFMIAYMILGGYDLSLVSQDNLLSFYPNPFHEFIKMKFFSLTDQDVVVEVFDAIGKLVYHKDSEFTGKSFNIVSLPLEDVQKGIYFLSVRTANRSYVKKVVKY